MPGSQHPQPAGTRHAPAFSLTELVLVVIIIGIITAIAAPRVSQAARQSRISSLKATVASVQRSIDLFYADHGRYPGFNPANGNPNDAFFVRQLTHYTDDRGAVSETYGYPYIFGPYLRGDFPVNPFNGLATVKVKRNAGEPEPLQAASGWVTVLANGAFRINATAGDITAHGIQDIGASDITGHAAALGGAATEGEALGAPVELGVGG